jgi:hypothetical protein
MPIFVGFLWAVGGALITLVGLVIWAASQEPSGAASRPSRPAPDESLVTAARIKELEEELKHQSDLAKYVDTDLATTMLIVAGSAAQRAKFGHADYPALRPLLAKGIVNHLPATTSEKFKQALAQARPLQVIAAAAVKYGLSEAATNIILDVFGHDQATWSPAEQHLFREWQRCLEDADKESV